MSGVRGGKDDDITVLLAAVKVRRSMGGGPGQEELYSDIGKSSSDDGSRAQA